MAYSPRVWQNDQAPFLNAQNLNAMERGIEGAHTLLAAEVAAREQADSDLTDALGSESVARQQGDAALAGNLESEASARQAGDAAISQALTAHEETTAQNVHGETPASIGAKPESYVPAWEEITGKPSTYPPAPHNHDARYVRTVNGTGPDASGNVQVEGGGGNVPSDAYCVLSRTTTQDGIASGSWTDVIWNSEITDPRNWHSNTTNPERITVDAAGLYGITAYMLWSTLSGTGGRGIRILAYRADGSYTGSQVADWVNSAVQSNGPCSTLLKMQLEAGGFFLVQVRQDSGSNNFQLSAATNATITREF